MSYQLSFYLQSAASFSSIFILAKGKQKVLSFIPFIFLITSYIFKPHFSKDNLQLINSFYNQTISTDPKYFLINNLFKFFGTNVWIFIFLQILASIIVVYLFYISLPRELLKEKKRNSNLNTNNGHLTFIAFNYLLIGLTYLSIYHPRQFLSNLIVIYCLFQISIVQKKSKNIKLNTLSISFFAILTHITAIFPSFYILYLYIKNNNFFKLTKIKIIAFKDTLFQRYINLFILIIILLLIFLSISILYTFSFSLLTSYLGIGGIGAYTRELDYYTSNKIGFLLPIITLIPIVIYTSIIPFSNFFIKIKNEKNLKNYINTLNLYSFLSLCIIFLEAKVNFYSIGRLKTILLPFLFFLIFKIPKQNTTKFLRISSLVLIYLLSIFSVYRGYSNTF